MSSALYTIGHSTHSTDDFIGLLKRHGVDAVCDVRSNPYSGYMSQYNREAIKGELKRNGIQYVFLGEELGARSENPDYYAKVKKKNKVQFDKLADDPLFQDGLERVRKGMEKYTIALMCAEENPIVCHRMILVTRHLQREFSIKHIRGDGSIDCGAEAEERLVNEFKDLRSKSKSQSSFISESANIEDAYGLQGKKIAYSRKDSAQPQPQVHEDHEKY